MIEKNKILSFFQLLLIPALYFTDYYSKRRMGFMRYLVYLNRKWETFFLSENFKFLILTGGILIFLHQLWRYFRKKSFNPLLIIFSLTLVGVLRKLIFSGITNNIFIIGIIILIFLESIKK
ncbi:MAG: hypothetical protein ACRCU6_07285 [Fusobacteriaceae bacterium]